MGVCIGGNNAWPVVYKDRNCRDRCEQDEGCTNYLLPADGNNWCETYFSEEATGDGDSRYTCFTKQIGTSSTCISYISYIA